VGIIIEGNNSRRKSETCLIFFSNGKVIIFKKTTRTTKTNKECAYARFLNHVIMKLVIGHCVLINFGCML